MSLGSIVVSLSLRTADFETDTGRAASIAKRRAREIDAAFTKAGVAIGAALGAAAVVLNKYVQNTIEAEKVQAQLASRIKDTVGAAGRSLEQLGDQADKLQGLTIFEDEVIGNAQAMLLTFTQIRGLEFDRTIESALDLATVMGTDATAAAKLLGRALSDPEKGMSALSRAGIVFADSEREAIKAMADMGDMAGAQDTILDKLEGTMGSAAEAARNTLGGALQGLQNTVDNLLEGDTSAGGLKGTVDAVNRLNDSLNDPAIKRGIDAIATGLLGMAGAAGTAVAKLGELIGAYQTWLANQGLVPDGSEKALSARKDKLEARIAQLQKPSMYGSAPDPLGKALGFDQLKLLRQELAKVNAELVGSGINRAFEGLGGAKPRGPAEQSPGASRPRSSGGSARGSSRRAQALPDFRKEDEEALRRMVEQTSEANEAFERMAATLSGPLAEAEFGHQKALEEITQLGLEAGRASSDVTALKAKEVERYEAETAAILERMNPAAQLLKDLEFERQLLSMTNAERQTAIQLRGMDTAAVKEYGEAILQANQQIESQERALADQVEAMDGLRDSTRGFFEDLSQGVGIWDALSNAANNFADILFDMASKKLVEQIFGMQGSSGGGGFGDIFGSILGGIFGGGGGGSTGGGGQFGWIGKGYSGGGWTGPGGMFQPAGIVHKDEVVFSKQDTARHGGVAEVDAMRRGRRGRGGVQQNNTFIVQGEVSHRTQTQIAQKAGLSVQAALAGA